MATANRPICRLVPILFALSLVGLSRDAMAVPPLKLLHAIVIESREGDAPDRLLITGRNLDPEKTVEITLCDTPLKVLERASAAILAEMPQDWLPGAYELIAWTRCPTVREDSMFIALGIELDAGAPFIRLSARPSGRAEAPAASVPLRCDPR